MQPTISLQLEFGLPSAGASTLSFCKEMKIPPCLRCTSAAATLLISSCGIYDRDLSAVHPYASHIGHPLALKEPMVIINDVGSYNPRSPNQLDSPIYVNGREVLRHLKPGDLVQIDSVRWVNTIDQADVVALGSTIEQGYATPIKFEYYWGNAWRIRRAPWEDRSIPENREIEWRGALKQEEAEQVAP